MGTVGDVVLVLDAYDVADLAGLLNPWNFDFAEADMPDLALFLHLDNGAEGFFDRCFGVDAVQLPKVETLELEIAQAEFNLLGDVLRPADGQPLGRALTGEAALRGDDDSGLVGRERLADESLADGRTVGVGGVDEVDAEFDDAAEQRFRGLPVCGLVPDTLAHDAHGAEAEPVDFEIAAEFEGLAAACRCTCHA